MGTLAERLSSQRKKLGLSQQELAQKSGVTRVAISKAEQGLTKNFNGNTLFKIAAALGCSADWLQTGVNGKLVKNIDIWDANVSSTVQKEHKYTYPKINWVQAGNFTGCMEDFKLHDATNWLDSVKYAGERGFWLEVHGDSMTAPAGVTFPEGMSILVNPDKDVYPSCYVVAKLKDNNEATFKKYVTDMGRDYLKPLNPNYPMIEIDYSECEIVGVVVDARWDIF